MLEIAEGDKAFAFDRWRDPLKCPTYHKWIVDGDSVHPITCPACRVRKRAHLDDWKCKKNRCACEEPVAIVGEDQPLGFVPPGDLSRARGSTPCEIKAS